MAWNKEDRNRLAEIWKEMLDLAEEAKNLIRVNGSRFDFEHAKAYWLGSILAALDNGEYMETNTFKKYLEDQGYDADNDSFEDDDDSEEEEEDESDDNNEDS